MYVLGLTAEKALQLDFEEDYSSDTDMATVTFLTSVPSGSVDIVEQWQHSYTIADQS